LAARLFHAWRTLVYALAHCLYLARHVPHRLDPPCCPGLGERANNSIPVIGILDGRHAFYDDVERRGLRAVFLRVLTKVANVLCRERAKRAFDIKLDRDDTSYRSALAMDARLGQAPTTQIGTRGCSTGVSSQSESQWTV